MTMKRPTKFTSIVRLDLVSPNKVSAEFHRAVVSPESSPSSNTANRYIVPRTPAEALPKQPTIIGMSTKEEDRHANTPTASSVTIPRPKDLTLPTKSSHEPQHRRHHEMRLGEALTPQSSTLPSPANKPAYITSSSAKRHLNDGQDGGNAYCKRYVYPDGVVFHTTGSYNTTSPTSVSSPHRQESRKSRAVVVPTSPMSNSSKSRPTTSGQPYHPHHHHHHSNGVSIGVGSNTGGLNGIELCDAPTPPRRRAANARGHPTRSRSVLEMQPASPQQSPLSPSTVNGMSIEKVLRHSSHPASGQSSSGLMHRTNGFVSPGAKVSVKSFARKDKKGEENGYVHTRAGSRTRFNTSLEVLEADDYDRRSEKTWAKLTPSEKASIREELNLYKSNEMKVHEDSRQYTRYHR